LTDSHNVFIVGCMLVRRDTAEASRRAGVQHVWAW